MASDITNLLPTKDRDTSLGRYMDAWSRLESAMHYAIQEILGLDPDAAHVIWTALSTYQSIKVLEASAKLKFNESGRNRAVRICEKLLRRNTRRNFIVHGAWRYRARLNPLGGPAVITEWRRVYSHIDPDLDNIEETDAPDGSDLTIQGIDKATGHVEEMVSAIMVLADDTFSLLAQPRTLQQ